MRSQSISTIQDVYAASLDMRATYCDVCSIRLHQPGCVRRIIASYILVGGRVCVTCVVGASSSPHQPSRLHCAMSLSPPLSSAIQDVYAASKRAAPGMRSQSISTIQDVYAASLDMRATYCDVCSITSGVEASAATPTVVSLTRERSGRAQASLSLRSTRATSWQALVRSRARSLRPLIQSTIGMCKPHQRCSDNRSHHAGCVCRIFRRASYILRCVRYLSTNRMFMPHLSTCELHPGCVCVCRIIACDRP